MAALRAGTTGYDQDPDQQDAFGASLIAAAQAKQAAMLKAERLARGGAIETTGKARGNKRAVGIVVVLAVILLLVTAAALSKLPPNLTKIEVTR